MGLPEADTSSYRRAGREEKGRILDEFCKVDGIQPQVRGAGIKRPPPEKRPPKRRPRRPSYGPKVVMVLTAVWKAAGYPWSVRLKALLRSGFRGSASTMA